MRAVGRWGRARSETGHSESPAGQGNEMRFDETVTSTSSTGRAGAPFREARRETPAPDAWRSSGVLLVLCGSAGAVVFLGVGMISAGLGWPVKVALVAGGLATLIVFALMLLNLRALLYTVETIVGHDLNRDGAVGPVGPVGPQVLQVTLTDPEAKQVRYMTLPGVTAEQLVELAEGIVDGRPLTEAAWTGRGRTFSKKQLQEVRSELVARGLAVWRSPGSPPQGVELTRGGRAAMEEIARTRARAGNGGLLAPGEDSPVGEG